MTHKGQRALPRLLGSLKLLLAGTALSACTHTATPTTDAAHIEHSILTMVNAVDSKRWELARSQFADQVFVDYSSLTGQPGGAVDGSALIDGWRDLLGEVNTHHIISNIEIQTDGARADVYSHVYASHTAEGVEHWDVFGRYHHTLSRQPEQWKITGLTFTVHGQKGNLAFFQQANGEQTMTETPHSQTTEKVSFDSEGEQVVGNLYLPEGYDPARQYPAVIVSGSWTTVKEQMAGLYAQKLANRGFITLAFDPRNFGESGGKARFYENPAQKTVDISSAVSFLEGLASVDNNKIGALGICAGSMYTLMAAAKDKRIKSVVTVASWLHDAEAVKLFYGGDEGVQEKVRAAQRAKQKYAQTGEVDYVPSISTTDPTAAMYGPFDYYLNPARGAVPEWSADKFAVMSWEDWLTLDPMPSAKELTAPTLMIHSDGAVLPQYTKQYFASIATDDKMLYWMETELESPFHQFNFYDQPDEVNESVEQAGKWFGKHL